MNGVSPDVASKLAERRDELFFKRITDALNWVYARFKELCRALVPLGRGAVNVGKGAINLFRSPPGEYITFILFIILIFFGVAWLAFSSSSPFRKAGSQAIADESRRQLLDESGRLNDIWDKVKKYLVKLNIDTSWLNKFRGTDGNSIPTVPRKEITAREGGRCDGINNIDVATDASKVCLNAKMPVTIEWDIDPTLHSGWSSLPASVQEKLLREKGGQRVYIPWGVMETPSNAFNPFAKLKKEANTLVPLCSQAYYTDGSSAAHLFQSDEETVGSCKRAIVPNRIFTRKTTGRYEDIRAETKEAVNRGEGKTCTL